MVRFSFPIKTFENERKEENVETVTNKSNIFILNKLENLKYGLCERCIILKLRIIQK